MLCDPPAASPLPHASGLVGWYRADGWAIPSSDGRRLHPRTVQASVTSALDWGSQPLGGSGEHKRGTGRPDTALGERSVQAERGVGEDQAREASRCS